MSGGIRPKGSKSYAATRCPEAAEAFRQDQAAQRTLDARVCPKCGSEILCETCIDGELASQYYTPGEWDWAEGESPPDEGPEACETCEIHCTHHRCLCGHEEKVE